MSIRLILRGDIETARAFVPDAQWLLNKLKTEMSFNNLSQLSRSYPLESGDFIRVQSIFEQDIITIESPFEEAAVVEEEAVEYPFIIRLSFRGNDGGEYELFWDAIEDELHSLKDKDTGEDLDQPIEIAVREERVSKNDDIYSNYGTTGLLTLIGEGANILTSDEIINGKYERFIDETISPIVVERNFHWCFHTDRIVFMIGNIAPITRTNCDNRNGLNSTGVYDGYCGGPVHASVDPFKIALPVIIEEPSGEETFYEDEIVGKDLGGNNSLKTRNLEYNLAAGKVTYKLPNLDDTKSSLYTKKLNYYETEERIHAIEPFGGNDTYLYNFNGGLEIHKIGFALPGSSETEIKKYGSFAGTAFRRTVSGGSTVDPIAPEGTLNGLVPIVEAFNESRAGSFRGRAVLFEYIKIVEVDEKLKSGQEGVRPFLGLPFGLSPDESHVFWGYTAHLWIQKDRSNIPIDVSGLEPAEAAYNIAQFGKAEKQYDYQWDEFVPLKEEEIFNLLTGHPQWGLDSQLEYIEYEDERIIESNKMPPRVEMAFTAQEGNRQLSHL